MSRSGSSPSAGSSGAAWRSNTAYKAGDVVSQGGVLYAANADHTSGGSFNVANWTQLPPDASPTAKGVVQLAGDLAGTATAPAVAAGAITDTKVAAANKDGAAGTPSLRTLGPGAAQAAAGNDSRLSNARTPVAHAATHTPGGSDVLGGVFRGAWAATTDYKARDLATQGGLLYVANADFTSGGAFNAANWTIVGVDLATVDTRHDPQYPPGVCAPQGNAETVGATAPGANVMVGCRVIVPRTGTLRDLYVINGTASGNVRASVYDVGATTTAVRTRLWDGSSTPAAIGWLSLGDPALPVVAGTHLDFSVMADNATATFGRRNTSGRGDLPGVLGQVNGCNFEIGWQFPAGAFTNPATLTEANTNASVAIIPVIVGRIA